MPTAPPITGPTKVLMFWVINTERTYPPIQPSELRIIQRQAFCIRLYNTDHCKAAMTTPAMMIGIPLKKIFPINQPSVVAMIQ